MTCQKLEEEVLISFLISQQTNNEEVKILHFPTMPTMPLNISTLCEMHSLLSLFLLSTWSIFLAGLVQGIILKLSYC